MERKDAEKWLAKLELPLDHQSEASVLEYEEEQMKRFS